MRPASLKNTILLVLALLVVLPGLVISQLVVHRYSAHQLDAATDRAQQIARKLALEAADKILLNDLVALRKMLDDQIESDPNVGYLFVIRDGRPLSHTFANGFPVDLIEANAAAGNPHGHIQKIRAHDGQRYIDVAYPIFGGNAGTLRVGLREAAYRRQAGYLWLQMSLVTSGILLLALGLGRWAIGRLLCPLEELTRMAERIDAGHLDAQVAVHGPREVGQLASAFNSMLARLSDHARRLHDYNLSLEEKNRELDRAHKQLETSFAISQQITALSGLDQICQQLIRSLKEVVQCRNLHLLLLNPATRSVHLATLDRAVDLDSQHYDRLYAAFNPHIQLDFIRQPELGRLHILQWIGDVDQLAVFPIRHHDLMIGAMLVACSGDCTCIRHELDIVGMILHQAAGAIHRANLHQEELRQLRQRVEADSGFAGIIGKDPSMQVVFKLIEDVSPTDATVLILGESGTGKELVARAIHERSHRSEKPFVVINCTAYASTLLESELFGHEKGAFTGALRRKIGRFEQADGGTVFLDEIGEIDATAQIKLLRVLQQQTIERLGGDEPVKVNVRILAATNKNLQDEVRQGRFREDLFYRLNVIPIQLPPLRARGTDIYLLAQHFLKRFAAEQGKAITGFRSEALRKLIENDWPGNVRELENSVEHAVVLAKESQIELKDLPSAIVDAPTTVASVAPPTIVESEERLIREALAACDWNKTKAAQLLGISRSTLYEKLKRLQILNPTLH